MNEHENMPFLKIKYRLCATLDRREGDKPLRYNTSLMVHEAPDGIPKKNRNQSDAEQITTWCCCNQGTSTMAVTFNKVNFTPDEVAVANIRINNGACKIKCETVILKLVT